MLIGVRTGPQIQDTIVPIMNIALRTMFKEKLSSVDMPDVWRNCTPEISARTTKTLEAHLARSSFGPTAIDWRISS